MHQDQIKGPAGIGDTGAGLDAVWSENTPTPGRREIGRRLSEKHVARAIELSVNKYCSASATFASAVDLSHDYEIIERE